jgi:hypothetical protein
VFAIALLSLTGLQTANAQAVWQQNIEIRVPVERGSEISAFRDALIEQIREQSESEDSEEITIKRRSRDQDTQDLSSIESELISEGWGGLSIANTLYISYTFTEGRNGFREQITSQLPASAGWRWPRCPCFLHGHRRLAVLQQLPAT